MLTVAALIDQNRCWLPRALRQEWNKRRAWVCTKTLQVRPDCCLALIRIASGLNCNVVWTYQLAPNSVQTNDGLSPDGSTSNSQIDFEGAVFLFEASSAFEIELIDWQPLETSGYWVWTKEQTDYVIVLCKRTLEMSRVHLPFAALAWIGNTRYQSRDMLILVIEEADQRRVADDIGETEEMLDMMIDRCARSLSQGRKSLLPGSITWSCKRSDKIEGERTWCNDPDLYDAESVFAVYEADLGWLDSIPTLRQQVLIDATPLPQDTIDLVLDYVDGGSWRKHLAALVALTC
jgi:hypothetical protein